MRILTMAVALNLLLPASSVLADSNPVYGNGILAIPTIDSVDTAGAFQEVVIEMTSQGKINLISYLDGVPIGTIESVNLIQTESFPVQIFLEINGNLPDLCLKVGQVNYKFSGSEFDVVVYYLNNEAITNPGEASCADAVVPFTKTIALPVFELSAGDYSYIVNDKFSGTFNIPSDNGF